MKLFGKLKNWYRRSTAVPFVPPGMGYPVVGLLDTSEFNHAIELLNDDITPMQFVVSILKQHAKLSESDALVAMSICHVKGGVLIPMPTLETAESASSKIRQSVQAAKYPLSCRAVTANQAHA
jgi:ATP-dependent Clp protease adapter protein ClpS